MPGSLKGTKTVNIAVNKFAYQ